MKIDLSLIEDQAFLLLPCKSGAVYTNQAGGYACKHPEMEGIIIPIADSGPLIGNLEEYFTAVYGDWASNGISYDDAYYLDKILVPYDLHTSVMTIGLSMQSWMYVHRGGQAFILTWPNSD